VPGNGSDNPNCDVSRVPLVGVDLDTQGSAVEHRSMFSPVQQRPLDEGAHDDTQPAFIPDCRFGSPAQLVLAAGHQIRSLGRSCKRWRVRSVVLAAGGFGPSCKRGVEAIG
jgi:hypothetical protein